MAVVEGTIDVSGPPEVDPVIVKLRVEFSWSRAKEESVLPGGLL